MNIIIVFWLNFSPCAMLPTLTQIRCTCYGAFVKCVISTFRICINIRMRIQGKSLLLCSLTPLYIMPQWSVTGWGHRRFADGPSPAMTTTPRSALICWLAMNDFGVNQHLQPVVFSYFAWLKWIIVKKKKKSHDRNARWHQCLICPCRRTPMIAEELLFYLSLPLSSSPVSPSRHSSPDDGQLDSFTNSHIKKDIQMNQQMCLDTGHLKWIFFFF